VHGNALEVRGCFEHLVVTAKKGKVVREVAAREPCNNKQLAARKA